MFPNSDSNTSTLKRFWWLAFAIFLLAQLYLTAQPFFARSGLVELDDAYGYILKAEQMRSGCFFQDCPALQDLRAQFNAANTDLNIAYENARQYHRLFVIYHPLHSLLLIGLLQLGLTYEAGYIVLVIAAKLILCLGLAAWLHSLFDTKVSAVALLLLAPIVFPGQGIHTMVPSNMTLGLAFAFWAAIATQKATHRSYLGFLTLLVCLVSLHQVGKLYAGVGLGLLLLQPPFNRAKITWLASGGLIVGLSFIAPLLLASPELAFNPLDFYVGDWQYAEALQAAIPNMITVVGTWAAAFGYPQLSVLFIAAGLYQFSPAQIRAFVQAALPLMGILILGTFYVVPWFDALLFERAWIPFSLLLFGPIANAVATSVEASLSFLTQLAKKDIPHFRQPVKIWANLLLGPLLLFAACTYFPFYARHYAWTLESQISRQNFSPDRQQPIEFFETLDGPDQEKILYTAEVPLYFYLTYGGLHQGAIYFSPNHQAAGITHNASEIDYTVSYSETDGVVLPYNLIPYDENDVFTISKVSQQ